MVVYVKCYLLNPEGCRKSDVKILSNERNRANKYKKDENEKQRK